MSQAPADAPGDAHALDLEPVQTLSAGEPLTPPWIPTVGIVLFFTGAFYLLATNREATSTEPTGEPTATSTAAVADAPAPQPRGAQPTTALGQQPMQLSPEALAAARRQLEAAKARGAMPIPPGQPGTAPRPTTPTAGH